MYVTHNDRKDEEKFYKFIDCFTERRKYIDFLIYYAALKNWSLVEGGSTYI